VNRAVLSMYEWPETADDIARLWQAIRNEIGSSIPDVPADLDHRTDLYSAWQSPDLLVGQTCGLPLVRTLQDSVCVLGTFDHLLPNTAAGDYHSVLIVNQSNPALTLADLATTTVAVNGLDSQSGYATLVHHVAPLANNGHFFGRVTVTGGHRNSVKAVADGVATLAAIDAVSWELALAHEPAARQCRVLDRTDPTPGLPLITSKANAQRVDELAGAVGRAAATLPESVADALHIHGFVRHDGDDYSVLSDRLQAASALGYETLG